jgi:predicted dehydrogenase
LIFHGTHYVDALQWLLGDTITDVAALTANVGGTEIENEDAACVSFRIKGGLMGTLNAG